MILHQIESELATISRNLKNITVEIAHRLGGGSGVIWRDDGLIVTNSHVVGDKSVDVRLEDRKIVKGEVIARNRSLDLAVIEVNEKQLPTPKIGNSRFLQQGEVVLAMGSPYGFGGTMSAGVIHSLNKKDNLSAIAADIRLAPGNSGGVLANVCGEVIGINTAIYQNMALAIPSHLVTDWLKSIGK